MAASKTSPKAAARKAARPIVNEAQARLTKLGVTLGQLASATEKGRPACTGWMNGTKRPDTSARQAIFVRWPSVEPQLWDVIPQDGKPKKSSKSKASAKARQGQTDDFRTQVQANIAAIDAQLTAAQDEGRMGDVSKFLGLKQRALVDAARFNGELSSLDEAKLTSTARFVEVRQAIAKALAPFPEAARAVAAALEKVGA